MMWGMGRDGGCAGDDGVDGFNGLNGFNGFNGVNGFDTLLLGPAGDGWLFLVLNTENSQSYL